MKILMVLLRWNGGVGRVVSSLKKELERRGHQVDTISREDYLNCFSLMDSIPKLRNEVKKREYDILYTHDWSCYLSLYGLKNQYVCYHGYSNKFLSKFIQNFLGRRLGKRLIVVSDFLGKLFPEAHILYNGVNKKEFYDLGKQRKFFGWIERPYCAKEKWEIEMISNEYGLPLSIAKDIPPGEMNKWYNTLKAFASYPPSYAGFNMCWLEAKAAGVPLLLGNENGIGLYKINMDWKDMTWENNINKLLKIFNKENGVK